MVITTYIFQNFVGEMTEVQYTNPEIPMGPLEEAHRAEPWVTESIKIQNKFIDWQHFGFQEQKVRIET